MILDSTSQTALPTGASRKAAVDGVSAPHVPLVWAQAWPWLKAAIDRFPNIRRKFTEASLLNDLAHSRAQLWVAWDEECVGAVITTITLDKRHPDKKLMEIPLVGGEGFNDWGDNIWTLLKEWGRAAGCTHAVGYGRRGWIRRLGFNEYGVTEDGVLIMAYDLREDDNGRQ